MSELDDLRNELDAANQRIADLEAATKKRLPYVTADEIENALAALNYARQVQRERQDMIANAIHHLQKARQGK